MKIYTKTGDDGTTGMIGGTRAKKNEPRIDCYGTVDELNAAIGLAASSCQTNDPLLLSLRRVQNELFVIGSHLAVPARMDGAVRGNAHLPALDVTLIERLEREIDAAETRLLPLQEFILPGGSELASRIHLARAISRRAERLVVALDDASEDGKFAVTYLNRLSDWLFVMARLSNQLVGVADIPWKK